MTRAVPRTFTMKPPASPPPQNEIGPGFLIGFLAGCAMIIASFVVAIRADDDAGRWRGFGWIVFSFGATFGWGAVHTVWANWSVGWSYNFFGRRADAGTLHRDTTPVRYWIAIAGLVLMSSTLIIGGLWLRSNAELLAEKLSEHRTRPGP